jgi:mono/diheme cytochrome c family protein
MLKKILKWTAVAVVALGAIGFVAFLYVIPPLTLVAPEEFVAQTGALAPPVTGIADPAERARAEHGRYIVLTNNCAGCHVTQAATGPDPSMYLAGGMTFLTNTQGRVVARNLTPDRETGLGRRSDEEVIRVLRSGTYPDGTAISHRAMPWAAFSNWTDEDLRDVIAYLRHLKPIRHAIPARQPGRADAAVHGAAEVAFSQDAGKK